MTSIYFVFWLWSSILEWSKEVVVYHHLEGQLLDGSFDITKTRF
jgi:hypothetical protein